MPCSFLTVDGEMPPPGNFPGMRQLRPHQPGFPPTTAGEMKKALQEKIKEQAAKMGYFPSGSQTQGQPRGPAPNVGTADGAQPSQTAQSDAGQQPQEPNKQGEKKVPTGRPQKQSLSEDDKPDDTDELGDFLSKFSFIGMLNHFLKDKF